MNDKEQIQLRIPRTTVQKIVTCLLVKRVASLKNVTAVSSIEIDEVIAANTTRKKNKIDRRYPPGILLNRVGRVSKIKPGPEFGANPKVNITEKTITPISTATAVSPKAIQREVRPIGLFLSR